MTKKREYKRKYVKKRTPEEIRFIHRVWKDSIYSPSDVAFRIRAVTLARLECELYHLELLENQERKDDGLLAHCCPSHPQAFYLPLGVQYLSGGEGFRAL